MPARKLKTARIRLLLADDHPLVLEGIKAHLSAQAEFEVVGDASDGLEALQKARQLEPDVILMDLSMPNMNGLDAISRLRQQVPKAKILVLSMHDNREYIARVVRHGARGYLLKDSAPTELIKAIKLVHSGEVYFSPTASRVLLDELVNPGKRKPRGTEEDQLTDREREVLIRIAEGNSNKDIASHLGLSVRTVETHREHIMRKLGIHSVAGLTKFALAHGMTSL